ncbi:hypothetical protein ACFVYE_19215 [Streptomyces sp. NPDC058239]|uniref:hypothetical protein n=1 Tax=unclassified Streptomyces TaxID=2593676 RepID=UPI00364E42FF
MPGGPGHRSDGDAPVAFADACRSFAWERLGRYEARQMRIGPAVAARSSAYHRTIETTGAMLRATPSAGAVGLQPRRRPLGNSPPEKAG